MNALEIRGLCKSYDGFSLDNLNLTLPSGCIMGLIGENGAGKSTSIKLILDMIEKDSGTVTVLGNNESDLKLTKEDVGVVLDELGLSGCLNVLKIGKIMSGIFENWENDTYLKYIDRFDIPHKKAFKTYSRGMKMKLGIAIALSHNAKLLILDEATSGLDPVAREDVLDILNDFTRSDRHSVLISSHIVSDLEKICDYIAFLHKGKLILCDEKDRLKERYGMVYCSDEELSIIPPSAIKGKKRTEYGTQVIVERDLIDSGLDIRPIDIEQLFVLSVKEGNAE